MVDATETGDANEVAVLVPAAGEGRRLGGTRKQFRTLGDRPLLVQVLSLFEQHPDVGHLVVSVPENVVASVSNRLQAEGLTKLTAVVSGGETRQASVRHALRAVPAPTEAVLVHDAARPFVTAEEVRRVVRVVRRHGAAALAVSVADTLRASEEGEMFGDTVPRDGVYRMQTPQGFRRAWLEDAHATAADAKPSATDDVELVQQAGREVHVVTGSRRNFKITTAADWALAQQLWGPWVNDPDRTALSSS
ncbi:MAG: 2-C-methyl-D-erythritol 4-phosphate cytidylyltransferase [Salinibacter sp.]